MTKDEVFTLIKKHILLLLPDVDERDIKPEAKMADLGANSIDRADIVVNVMEELAIKVPLLTLGQAKNIGDLTDIFYQIASEHE